VAACRQGASNARGYTQRIQRPCSRGNAARRGRLLTPRCSTPRRREVSVLPPQPMPLPRHASSRSRRSARPPQRRQCGRSKRHAFRLLPRLLRQGAQRTRRRRRRRGKRPAEHLCGERPPIADAFNRAEKFSPSYRMGNFCGEKARPPPRQPSPRQRPPHGMRGSTRLCASTPRAQDAQKATCHHDITIMRIARETRHRRGGAQLRPRHRRSPCSGQEQVASRTPVRVHAMAAPHRCPALSPYPRKPNRHALKI